MNDMLEPTPDEESPEMIAADGPRVNDHFLGRLVDLVAQPSRLMENVGFAPRWWQAGLLVFVVIAAFSWLTVHISGPEQMEMMRDSRFTQLMPAGEWERAYADAMDPSMAKRITQSLGAGISTWVMMMVLSLVLGFFAKMSGGQGKMKQSMGIVHWASIIPFVIMVLIKLPLVLITESVFSVNLGLAALLGDTDPTNPLYHILATYGDFSNWWGLFVLVIGYRTVYRMTTAAAAVSVLLPWALLAAIPLAITLVMM